jgi:phosphoserine phosphatase RsbU/P
MPLALQDLDFDSIQKLREQELEEARTIQGVMLPSHPLREGRVTISHEFQPAAAVGGDYLDYFSLPRRHDRHVHRGRILQRVPAALYAALAVGTLSGVPKTGQNPTQVLSLLNERLRRRGIPGRHSAIQYAQFDPVSGQMHLVSAGMPGPRLFHGRECRVLQTAGIPPGLFPGVVYDTITIQLEPGDSLLFYTDGLTDTRNSQDVEFEAEGLQNVCTQHADESPGQLLGHIFSAVGTLLGIARNGMT